MRKRDYLALSAGALVMIATPMTAYAEGIGEKVGNFLATPFKATASVLTHTYKGFAGGVSNTFEGKPLKALGSVSNGLGRAGGKGLQDIGYGIMGGNAGEPSDIGSWNKGIEGYPVAKVVRNGVAVGVLTGGITDLFGGDWSAVLDATAIGAGAGGAVTAADGYLQK